MHIELEIDLGEIHADTVIIVTMESDQSHGPVSGQSLVSGGRNLIHECRGHNDRFRREVPAKAFDRRVPADNLLFEFLSVAPQSESDGMVAQIVDVLELLDILLESVELVVGFVETILLGLEAGLLGELVKDGSYSGRVIAGVTEDVGRGGSGVVLVDSGEDSLGRQQNRLALDENGHS